MSRKLEDMRLAWSTGSRQKQRTCPGWSAGLGWLAGMTGRVGGPGGSGQRARRAESGARRAGSGARRAGSGGMTGWVGGLGVPGRRAWRAGSAGMAGLVGLGGQAGAGRVVLEERAGWVRIGLGRVVPAVNVPVNGSLRCVCLRSWHVG